MILFAFLKVIQFIGMIWYCCASLLTALTAPRPQLQLPILSSPINFILLFRLFFFLNGKSDDIFLILTTKQFPKSLNLSYFSSCSPQFRSRGVVKHKRRKVCKWKANENYLFLDISVRCWVDGCGSHFHGDQLDCTVVREMVFDGEEISLERNVGSSPRSVRFSAASRRYPRALQWVVNWMQTVLNSKQQNGKQIELPAEFEVTAYSDFVIQSVNGLAEVQRKMKYGNIILLSLFHTHIYISLLYIITYIHTQ